MANLTQVQTTSDNLVIEFERALPLDAVQRAIEDLRSCDPGTLLPAVTHEALEGLKFSDCLPPELGIHVLAMRTQDWWPWSMSLGPGSGWFRAEGEQPLVKGREHVWPNSQNWASSLPDIRSS